MPNATTDTPHIVASAAHAAGQSSAAQSSAAQSSAIQRSQIVPLAFAGLLGVFIVGFVGFIQIDAVHNAGHDYRHSMAFPCH